MSRKRAFTLIELLVVISIILIATSVLFLGTGGGEGLKLSSAQRIVSGIAQGARGQALLKNTSTRIIIYSENNTSEDLDKALRFFGIIYQNPENENEWFAATQGDYLPEGIYFDPDLSSGNNWPGTTMNLEYPRQRAQPETGPEYYYYEFDANGTMSNNPSFSNSWLVLRAGTLKPGNAEIIDFSEEEKSGLKAALIFRRVGTTTKVSDPDEITAN
ncbi:MAG: prepilin-type N-terminal cleavage/methylation domain-containing protein [Opitutales bacterium]